MCLVDHLFLVSSLLNYAPAKLLVYTLCFIGFLIWLLVLLHSRKSVRVKFVVWTWYTFTDTVSNCKVKHLVHCPIRHSHCVRSDNAGTLLIFIGPLGSKKRILFWRFSWNFLVVRRQIQSIRWHLETEIWWCFIKQQLPPKALIGHQTLVQFCQKS